MRRILKYLSLPLLFTFLGVQALLGQQVFTVVNTFDGGPGSFRQALDDANASPGIDTIEFNVFGDGPHLLKPKFAYSDLEEAVVIDGFTQEGSVRGTQTRLPKLQIVLDGSEALDTTVGLAIRTDSCVIEGISIVDFGHSGVIIGGNHNVIRNNFIGVDQTGRVARGNGYRDPDSLSYDGIWIWQGTTNEVTGNILSGNAASGVWISSPEGGNLVAGNLIGTDPEGKISLPNNFGIVFQNSPENMAEDNVVSGNLSHGIVVANFEGDEGSAKGNVIRGNLIGLDATGKDPLANGLDGILVNGPLTKIGGPGPGDRNVISGNGETGIVIVSPSFELQAYSTIVQNNILGLTADGGEALPNRYNGIVIEESSLNIIGGDSLHLANIISGNGRTGIWVAEGLLDNVVASDNIIVGNFIGTDATGLSPMGNGWDGVTIQSASNNLVVDNVMVDQGFTGVFIRDLDASNNVIQSNYIGQLRDGTAMPNQDAGIDISQARMNLVGGREDEKGNYIAFNGAAGVIVNASLPESPASKDVCSIKRVVRARGGNIVSDGRCEDRQLGSAAAKTSLEPQGNAILRNVMKENLGRGIELGRGEVSPNDPFDNDSGPNNLQNTPVLATAVGSDEAVSITYLVGSSDVSSAYPIEIEFYIASVDGEGLVYLGSDTYALPQQAAEAVFEPEVNIDDGEGIVATATDAEGNTSEFSPIMTIVGGTNVAVEETDDLPAQPKLRVNYPNPFNPATTILYALPSQQHVRLRVYDTQGRLINTLVDGVKSAGSHQAIFDASDYPSGMYLYQLQTAEGVQSRWMTLVK